MDELQIVTGSRLHFGLICAPPGQDWHYGGIGLMIEDPAWQLKASLADSDADAVQGSPEVVARVKNAINMLRRSVAVPSVKIEVASEVSLHSGLGSGTQLALATGVAVELLSSRQRTGSSHELAAQLGRNRRSSIGSFGFDRGGFIVDRGRSVEAKDSLQSIEFPDEWRLVLLTPSTEQGLSGSSEESFFGEQQFLSSEVVLRLEQLVEHEIVASLTAHDFERFAAGLAEYGRVAGEYYATAQGGIFSNEVIRQVVGVLEEHGIHGSAQSSWGPTVCVPAKSLAAATEICQLVQAQSMSHHLQVAITRARNCGATVRSIAPEDQRSFG